MYVVATFVLTGAVLMILGTEPLPERDNSVAQTLTRTWPRNTVFRDSLWRGNPPG